MNWMRVIGPNRRARMLAATLAVGALFGFLAGLLGLVPMPEIRIRWHWPAQTATEYAAASSTTPGRAVALVFVGSSTCGWSNRPELVRMIKSLKLELKRRADNLGMSFAVIGAAKECARNERGETSGTVWGLRRNCEWARVDEYCSAEIHLGDELSGPAATPQVIVVEHIVDVSRGHMVLRDERVVARKTGLLEITQWVERGAPTPTLGETGDS